MSVDHEFYEKVRRASYLRFNGEDMRAAQMYSLGQILSERAKVAEFIMKGNFNRDNEAMLKEQYEHYNQMLKHYLGL
jgi:hypothetical protein